MDTELLTNLLGATDGTFAPLRGRFNGSRSAAAAEARSDFHRVGLLAPHPEDPAERKASVRRLVNLERCGLIVLERGQGRLPTWKLTDSGDWSMRAMAATSGFQECHAVMATVRDLASAGCTNRKFVGDWLIGLSYQEDRTTPAAREKCARVYLFSRPALVRGWLVSGADTQGGCGYKLTPEGLAFLDNPTQPDEDGQFNEKLHTIYSKAFDRAVGELKRARPRDQSAVFVPLPSGGWPSEAKRRTIPSVFERLGTA